MSGEIQSVSDVSEQQVANINREMDVETEENVEMPTTTSGTRPTQAPTLPDVRDGPRADPMREELRDVRDEGRAERDVGQRAVYVTPHGERYHLYRSCRGISRATSIQTAEVCLGCMDGRLIRQPLYKHVGPVLHMNAQHAWSVGFRTLDAYNAIGSGEVARVGRHFKAFTICRECLERRREEDGA